MKNLMMFLLFTITPLTSWGKIIAKYEVKNRFIEMANAHIGWTDDRRKVATESFKLIDPWNVEVSLPDGLSMLAEWVPGRDIYEVHADFYNETSNYKVHYNYLLEVIYEGIDKNNQHQYLMKQIDNTFEDEKPGPTFDGHRWTTSKPYY